MSISDTDLMAYADGELDAPRRAEIERALGADAALVRRLQAHRTLRDRVGAAFADELAEPVPDALRGALEPRERAVPRGEASNDPSWRWPHWAGLAASLLLGVSIGRGLLPGAAGDAPREVAAAGEVVAGGALERALSTQLAGSAADGSAVRVPISFVDRSGRYCRAFQAPRQAGVACRSADGWIVQALVDAPAPAPASTAADDPRQAGSGWPAALLEAIDARIAGAPLNAAQESAARTGAWRR